MNQLHTASALCVQPQQACQCTNAHLPGPQPNTVYCMTELAKSPNQLHYEPSATGPCMSLMTGSPSLLAVGAGELLQQSQPNEQLATATNLQTFL